MTTKHTPGPWVIDKMSENAWDVCVERETDWLVIHQATPAIDNFEDKLTDEDTANAIFISAAPYLLDRLQHILWAANASKNDRATLDWVANVAAAAIAHATGEHA